MASGAIKKWKLTYRNGTTDSKSRYNLELKIKEERKKVEKLANMQKYIPKWILEVGRRIR